MDDGLSRSVGEWARHVGADVDAADLRASLGQGTLVDEADATAGRWPDREAIGVGDGSLTHAELQDDSRRVAGWLRSQGPTEGVAVIVAAPNSVAAVVAYLAGLRTGAMVHMANPTFGVNELAGVIDRVRPMAIVAVDDMASRVDESGWEGPILVLDGDQPGSAPELDAADPSVDADIGPDTVAHLAFTSGTTGSAKATPLSHSNVLASVRAVMAAWRWSSDDVLVHALPLQHAHGLTAVHLTLLSGSRSVVLPRFDPEALCRTIAEERATVMFGVPAVYDRLLGWDGFRDADLSSLRLATSGSAPLSPRVSDEVATVLGHRPLERYGLTEAGFLLSNRYDGERLPGSVGWELPGVEIRLIDGTGAEVDDSEEGEIVTRGPQVFSGYIDVDAADTFTPDGWFRTGDLGVRSTETGAISITGRLKELIITGGMNVHPREVELVLEAHAGVTAAAVVGRPSDRWGEEVVAFIVLEGDLDTDELAEAVKADLASYKRPKSYVVVDDLPRNHMGKVLRADLAARLLQL